MIVSAKAVSSAKTALVVLGLSLGLAACGGSNRCKTNPAHLSVEVLPDIIVPADMNKPPHDRAMNIPQEERLAYRQPEKGNQVCVEPPAPLNAPAAAQ